jgi:hypothetical protein
MEGLLPPDVAKTLGCFETFDTLLPRPLLRDIRLLDD